MILIHPTFTVTNYSIEESCRELILPAFTSQFIFPNVTFPRFRNRVRLHKGHSIHGINAIETAFRFGDSGVNIFAVDVVIEGGRKIRTSEDWIKLRHKGVNSC